MKILLAPSETKSLGGEGQFEVGGLSFGGLVSIREKVVKCYDNIIKKNDFKVLSKMFGIKKEKEIEQYSREVSKQPVKKAVQRYTGVAFDHLDYNTLDKQQQSYVDVNVILFSNLFGPIMASDLIPEYKLKQGEPVGDVRPEQLYNKSGTEILEDFLKEDEILDLRAGFYDKFYKPKKEYTTIKFIKDGKVVSHWAKASRGVVVREMAIADIKSVEELIALKMEGLEFVSKEIIRNKTELVYNVLG